MPKAALIDDTVAPIEAGKDAAAAAARAMREAAPPDDEGPEHPAREPADDDPLDEPADRSGEEWDDDETDDGGGERRSQRAEECEEFSPEDIETMADGLAHEIDELADVIRGSKNVAPGLRKAERLMLKGFKRRVCRGLNQLAAGDGSNGGVTPMEALIATGGYIVLRRLVPAFLSRAGRKSRTPDRPNQGRENVGRDAVVEGVVVRKSTPGSGH